MKFCIGVFLRILHSGYMESMQVFDATSDRMSLLYMQRSRNNAFGIVTRLWVGKFGFQFPAGARDFHFSSSPRHDLGTTQPSAQCVPEVSAPGIKRPRYEADHSPPSRAEIKNGWSSISCPPICIHDMHKDKFIFTLSLLYIEKPATKIINL